MNQSGPGPDRAHRHRVERSVFLSQLLVGSATLLLVAVSGLLDLQLFTNQLFLAGILIILVATAVAAGVPWRQIDKKWIIALPIVDLVGLVIAREGEPLLGTTFLLVFPIIWLSTHFGGRGAIGGVVLTTALLWTAGLLRAEPVSGNEIPRLAIVPIVLAFVAATTYTTTKRAAAQRVLLTQQSVLFEGALRRSRREERTLDAIFNTVDFGVVGFSREAKPNFINRAQREMFSRFGVKDGQLSSIVVYHEDQVTPFAEQDRPFQRAMRGETVDRMTLWVGQQGQQQAAVLISARPILDENDNYDGGVMVSRDVTAELRAIKARDDLVASVSHELRTPLTSILGYLELALDDETLDPSTRRMLEVASKNSDRLLALVADLLTTAAATKHELAITLAPCDLSVIVTDAIESLRPVAAERDISFVLSVLPTVRLQADALRLRQVIDNLLSNAVKYNITGGRIEVSLLDSTSQVELRIADTGRGMTLGEQVNLFDRFYRADSVRGSSIHGTGLGLSISRDICRQHGGDLRLESAPGKGTTAIATLPRTS
ncbi:His Kinase A (phospho-acceptor) domain-containing protein [Cryobacterium flavum]|uniref:histidine kinase n=1 Tax=Cryobacterium flavum TaxID=1424659 RepID=A0A4R8V6I8_9MICO|nr:HAMP domain-containing sensor histidine kinase [Cryobacterium flavum]TFB77131.1 HAMP domain-containing histidine kinase [Cryobacterium flavum]SDN38628.1 His Kinase A (phospho-acceptor) domain-containing protein [Cryobacterium flavum]